MIQKPKGISVQIVEFWNITKNSKLKELFTVQ